MFISRVEHSTSVQVLYGFDNITKAVRRMVEGDNSNSIYRGIEPKTLILLNKAELEAGTD